MGSTPSSDVFEVGGYSLLSGVARDELAEHWIARSAADDSLVHLVRLTVPVAKDIQASSAFIEHLEAARRVEHPGVVRVIETHRDSDAVLGVLELVEGVSLDVILSSSEGKKLPLEIVLRVAHDVASALAALGAEGIAHGDLSPSTILLLPGGVSVLTPSGLGLATCRAGTKAPRARLAYKTPEQLAGKAADARSDVFALAATLFEALAGHRAFDAPGAALPEAPPGLAKALHTVLAQALAVDPALRPESAQVLARSLEDAAATKPAPRFALSALVSERAGRDLAALRFEVDSLAGKGATSERAQVVTAEPEPPVEVRTEPATRPELDAEPTPPSGRPPPRSAPRDADTDLFEDTQPSRAKVLDAELRLSQERTRRRRAVIVALVVAGLAIGGFAVGAGLRASSASSTTPAELTPAEATEQKPQPPPPAEPDPEPTPEPETDPAPDPTAREPQPEPAPTPAPARRATPRPATGPAPAPEQAHTTEKFDPPRPPPPVYTAPSKPPPAPTVDIPSGI